MPSTSETISHQELLRLVSYDPETGILTRKVRTSNRVQIGDIVGSLGGNGYFIARIGGHLGYVHQFVWLYVNGFWPEHDIDHRDLDKTNNRISNLRRATESQNSGNILPHSDSKSGIKGVHPKRDKWCAQIMCQGKRVTLGSFSTKEEAAAAYLEASTRMFGEFARAS
jgi:hypothetical protein